jgi:hypothetical protein
MKLIISTILLCLALCSSAQDYGTLIKQADVLYNEKNYAESVKLFNQAFSIEKRDPQHLYNAACSAALSGQKNLAFEWLNLAADNGWYNLNHLQSDSDLSSLRDSLNWNELISKIQIEVDKIEAKIDKPLRDELLNIFDEDQSIRREFLGARDQYGQDSPQVDSLTKVMIEKDSLNLQSITRILDTRGWVGPELVGGQANQAIFLVIQHADLATQQKYLPMMREAVQFNNASRSSLALLEDRIALGEGKKQIYGSQIGFDKTTGLSYVLPLIDPLSVDERRAGMDLGPLAEYVKRFGIVWNAEEYIKQLPEIEKKSKE